MFVKYINRVKGVLVLVCVWNDYFFERKEIYLKYDMEDCYIVRISII